MEIVHLNQKQLAARWGVAEATLERWRSDGIGPKYLKLHGRVLYRQVDVEGFEESCLMTSTSMKGLSQRIRPLVRKVRLSPIP
ncbi:DNA-binding protein [Burkholderia pseudomallei]|uniref:helix-turn-helix transcriptional regulator n=1 Tax=Burkholderia pseudomallei TaxID=28450 RepID=UPI000F4E0179|nr:DNA-binding protein [Burkholderia pseudomallei]RPE15424.1 DNA-binding protein [Burkholderia pseudomallei]RPE20045.1 DNA-binding protein [Burkholderia pseudomallei]RQS89232.1 DNA-binding protein [Burkholderia pseudomallei]RQZ48803.1 DNA-binding protein [Burkholderia pseudomallei]RSK62189.1 DNA-binding protein [Burkholderia pseudomallei]